ncbi:MAG: TRAP transporter substrate-binding protein DctP [Deltaproteobacteria bacterium]|nr:MAG: TRAP transporter substrate-binding protein DctP [Deltaproteobacteria bacterium]
MKKILICLIILLIPVNLVLAQGKSLRQAQGEAEYVVKLSAIAPEGTSWSDIGHQFADYVFEKSGGRLKVIWYLGGAMGDEPAAVRKLRLGQLQGGVFTVVGMAKILPEIRILIMPYLFKNYDEVDYVLGKMTPVFSQMFDEKGYKLFGWVEVGLAYFFSKKPILTLGDIRETKVWNWAGDSLETEIIEAMGYKNIIQLELFDVLMGLQTGLIETFFCPYYACLALQWYQYANYINGVPLAYTPGGILVNKKFYDSLPRDLRDIFTEASYKYFPKLIPMIRQDHEKALEGFIKHGIKVIEPTPETEKQNEIEAQEIYKRLGEKHFPQWLLTGVMNARNMFRAGVTE